MNKKILSFIFSALLFSGCSIKQELLVFQNESNSSKATLVFYENGKKIASYNAIVGKNGISDKDAKLEGDGKTPFGSYPITAIFGKGEQTNQNMSYIKTTPSLHCVDDSKSANYNRIIDSAVVQKDYDSYEDMLRSDGLYDIGAVIAYNESGAKGRGSCIFMHIAKQDGKPTAGCVALTKEDLSEVLKRLDISKKPNIVIEKK